MVSVEILDVVKQKCGDDLRRAYALHFGRKSRFERDKVFEAIENATFIAGVICRAKISEDFFVNLDKIFKIMKYESDPLLKRQFSEDKFFGSILSENSSEASFLTTFAEEFLNLSKDSSQFRKIRKSLKRLLKFTARARFGPKLPQ